ncbi:UTP--glucose-1-phosphate uridylyltransferase [Propionicicella superfundia]|uniref:UTP--glucose-1-phosphate uridylyltransferase n=1 Tax=Propionicicella superfundia TaxID=348582 RepID=UPI00042691D2|nr:UTP--glucose-1-phosphate uridylyltransferase [Propionicicella superfundia]
MTAEGLAAAVAKMRRHDCSQSEIDGFTHSYQLFDSGVTGMIPESSIAPLPDPPRSADVAEDAGAEALRRTAVLKLNGGLGTSMGLAAAKTLLPVREGLTFLDLIVEQVRAARKAYDVPLPLLFMNSFRTRDDTLARLASHRDLPVPGIPLDFLQSQYPKVREDDSTPVSWPADPEKEWCPPGHGEVFAQLAASGILAALLDGGYRYLSLSNGDNLGAAPSAPLAGWFASSGAPFAVEVCERTANDRKGGHLAVRRSDGRVILRELSQTPAEDAEAFMDASRHRFFNTNNLWVDLVALRALMQVRGTHLGLPLIKNRKTVDPADPASIPVIQLETAMGAAVEVFEGATAIQVDRSRFLPVKTTNELLLIRSDLFGLAADGRLVATRDSLPRVDLDPKHYQVLSEFEQRIPLPPSLSGADRLRIRGDVTFGAGVVVSGDVDIEVSVPTDVPAGAVLDGAALATGEPLPTVAR